MPSWLQSGTLVPLATICAIVLMVVIVLRHNRSGVSDKDIRVKMLFFEIDLKTPQQDKVEAKPVPEVAAPTVEASKPDEPPAVTTTP